MDPDKRLTLAVIVVALLTMAGLCIATYMYVDAQGWIMP